MCSQGLHIERKMGSSFFNTKNINNLIEISRNAGRAILEIYETNFDVDIKNDQSPLTKADLLSDKIISQALKKIDSSIPILSEESSKIPFSERSRWKEYWLVDPLDGTKEFIKKNGEFTTNIALIRGNRPIFGIIHAPAKNETYWGVKGIGSFFIKGDSLNDAQKISSSCETNNKLRIVTSRSHPSANLKLILDKLDSFKLINIGSSLKFCLVAKGEADCYPRLGPTCEWDTAAGEIIAEAAGAMVTNFDDKPLTYNKKDHYINPDFLACRNSDYKEMFLSKI